MMAPPAQRSRRTRLLISVLICCLLLAACGWADQKPETVSDPSAISSAVQTVNAKEAAARASQNETLAGVPAANTAAAAPTPSQAQVETAAPVIVAPSPSSGSGGESYHRTIRFSGQDWVVKSSGQPVGPGPNLFSDSPESVWVDESGHLHLKVIKKDGRWYCAEVVTAETLGYGSYQFKITNGIAGLDQHAVLGLFTWDTTAPQFYYREIDVEHSKWSEETTLNTQYVVQPWDRPGNRHRFSVDPREDSATHIFIWLPESVEFWSFLGEAQSPAADKIAGQWSYMSARPPPAGGAVNARINLWLNNGHPPSNGKEIEIVLSSFEFIPSYSKGAIILISKEN